MKVTWYGNASLKIESDKASVLIDPFVPMAPSTVPTTLSDYYGVKEILITHGHFDHIIDVPKLCMKGDVEVMATQTPINTLLAKGVKQKQLKVIENNKTYSVEDIEIKAFPAKHVKLDYFLVFGKKRLRNFFTYFSEACRLLGINKIYRENGEIVAYMVEAEGRSIFVLGSLGLRDDVDYPTGMDLLVLPYQGSRKLLELSQSIIDKLKPKTVLLDHFDNTFPPITANVDTEDIINKYAGKITILTIPYKTSITI